MDMVDTFNHLIPSDQLDDSLIIGQNLDSEASNEFGTAGLKLEDSLKNMLSDKDPMFGCASTQFNLLDNEDPAFQIGASAIPDSGSVSADQNPELTVKEATPVTRSATRQKKRPLDTEPERSDQQPKARGRPRRKPADRLSKTFLIQKGVEGSQLREELTLGGRVNINDFACGSWLNPTVVLKRLTVTIGGFRIELLPGPSYTQSVAASESICFEGGFAYGGDIGFAILPDDCVSVENPVSEADVTEKKPADDTTLGPYVNPNDVQTANTTTVENPCTQKEKLDNHSEAEKQNTATEGKDGLKGSSDDSTSTVSNKTDSKVKPQIVVKTLLKSKQGPTLNKNKDSSYCKTSIIVKEQKESQSTPSKVVQRGNLHKMKPVKEKPDVLPPKRPAESPQSELAPKVQKMQGTGQNKIKPKSPSAANSVVKKSPSASNRTGDHQGPQKHPHPPNSSKVETTHPAHSHLSNSVKTLEEGGQDKSKVKKPEKLLQRQKSKSVRSISVEEPQLFIPDNAPVVKKDSAEELAANADTAWDGNNCCGLCKKHHNNMFMVGCGRCDDWFHGDCVGLDLTKVREMEEEDQMYVCLKCCEEECKKVEPEPPSAPKPEVPAKPEVQDPKPPSHARPGPSQNVTSGGVRPFRKDPDRRQSSDGRETSHKTGPQHRHETKSKTSSASKKPVSMEAIRRNVRDSLKEILTQRLKESTLNISVDRATEVAKKTERELFHLYKDTDNKYKNKYRSLMFNLKDTKNNVLFKRVLKGEISPANLIRMSPEELASKELAAWRQRENRHTIEMIEKEQREVERRPITKITHKGEIEIESQEPAKTSEPVEIEPPPKVAEAPLESPTTPDKKAENDKTEKDTTSQHKSHLFDLHCKICTGRMAPPVEEAPTKVVKVATTVVRRQSTKSDEPKSSTTTPGAEEDLHLTVLEESFRNAHSSYEGRADHTTGRNEEVLFLSNLKSLWRGFIHMHNVAKLVTKAFPVSGILDNLTEDLPDSIQVGGRISPQTVWDYLEKIRATGTKEVCLIRFSPETEEDEISYTLLYAYFSSRKRFGVVSNNLKQVKDMYLIPLGATEKVPHQLVPFDGPGLENNRANLLLGLIIRQRPKRDFLTVDVTESERSIPDIKPIVIPTKEARKTEEEEKLFLSSLTLALKKEKDKTLNTTEEVDEPIAESLEGPSAPENSQEAQKPLRFLPGVLVGWGGELPPLPDVGGKSGTTASDTPKNQPAPKAEAASGNSKSPTAAAPRERFVIKKKEAKPVKTESELPGPADPSAANNSSGKDAAAVNYGALVSLKDKPPDVSTDAFLASLSTAPGGTEMSVAGGTNKGDAGLLSETEKVTTDGNPCSQSESQASTDHTSSSKPPLSGILKKSSAYSTATEDKTTAPQKQKASPPDPSAPKPVPVSSGKRNDLIVPFHQGYLQLAAQAKHKPEEQNRTAAQSVPSKKEDAGSAQPADETQETLSPTPDPEPEATADTQASTPQQDLVTTPTPPEYNSTPPFFSQQQQQQSQVPGSYNYPAAPPPDTFSSPPHTQGLNHNAQWAQDSVSQASPGSQSQYPESYSAPFQAKRPEERYSDPWERPRNTEDKDHHGRHRDSHHGKKSRHHDREREKKHERSHEDKHRDRSRHHGHSEDRHAEKRKERHHSDEYSSRHRHRHRRDSDYENGRRGSKDSYS
ncbi:unnamed protein product [Ophioblennius macclurei]